MTTEEINNIEDINNIEGIYYNPNLEQEQIKKIIIKYYQSKTHEFLESLIDFLLEYTQLDREEIRNKLVDILNIQEEKHILHIVNYTCDTSGENGYKNLQRIMKNEDLDELLDLLNIDKEELEKIENNNIKSPTIYNGHSKQTPVNYGESEDHKQQQPQNDKANFLIQSSIVLLRSHFHDFSHDIAKYFAGACFFNNHDVAIPLAVVKELGNNNNEYIEIVKQTYKKGVTEGKKKIKGLSGLENVLGGKNSPNFQYLKKILSVNLEGEEAVEEELDDLDKIRELTSDIIPFRDQLGIRYVNIDHINIPLDNDRVELYIRRICKSSEYNFTPKPETIKTFINELESRAEYENEDEIKLDVRVAFDPDDEYTWYYDLCDKKGRSIKITSEGWEVISNTPILFKRFKNMKAQVIPIPCDNNKEYWDGLVDLFNIKDPDIRLLNGCRMISTFIPNIDRAINMIHGLQGAGKTMFQEQEKKFTDPCFPLTLDMPETRNELIQLLHHNHNAIFDNTDFISDTYSNILCRTSTGGGFMKRALWKNDDDFPYDFRRSIGINGINLTTNRPDIRDRTTITEINRVEKLSRKDKEEIWKKFNELLPYALGYVFDILVKVNKLKKEGVDYVKEPNRMLQFHKYGELISVCMGNEIGKFTKIYNENIENQSSEIVENDYPCQVLKYKLEDVNEPVGIGPTSPTEFHKVLREYAIKKMGLSPYDNKKFPPRQDLLSKHYKRYAVDLLKQGIRVTWSKSGNRSIRAEYGVKPDDDNN